MFQIRNSNKADVYINPQHVTHIHNGKVYLTSGEVIRVYGSDLDRLWRLVQSINKLIGDDDGSQAWLPFDQLYDED